MAKRPIELLSAVEVQRLLGSCGRGVTAIRNRAIIVVLWRAGLRAGEALALAPKDVDLDRGIVRILAGKGQKARTVALDVQACDTVRRWKTIRQRRRWRRGAPLFCTLTGRPIESSYLRQMFPRLAKRARIRKRVHAHALRHLCAVELMREGTPLHVIAGVLGHTNVATTQRYLDHLEPREVVEALRGRSWEGVSNGKGEAEVASPRARGGRQSATNRPRRGR